ncbi:MAG: hypothetical protein AB1758_25165, partial [Candidatus Eremiobacterota bacterium]
LAPPPLLTRPTLASAHEPAWPTDPTDAAQLARALEQLDCLEADMARLEERVARLDSEAKRAHVRSRIAAQAGKVSLGVMVGGVFTALYLPVVGIAIAAVGFLGVALTGIGMFREEDVEKRKAAEAAAEQGRASERQKLLSDLNEMRVLRANLCQSAGIEERGGKILVGGVVVRGKRQRGF